MKKMLIGLLVVAAAGTSYYLYSRSKTSGTVSTSVDRNLVVGKWKTADAAAGKDSTRILYQYEFLKDGLLVRTVSDTVKSDTLRYEWNKAGALVWKTSATDTAGTVYAIEKLNADSMVLKTDSTAAGLLFTRLKQ